MRLWLARVLAVVLTVLPWAAALAQPRPAKADTALSSPQTPQPSLQQASGTSGTPPTSTPGLFWTLEVRTPFRLETVQLQIAPAPARSTPRYLECLKLQLDGG